MSAAPTLAQRAEYVAAMAAIAVMRLAGPASASAIGGACARMIGPLLKRPSNRARVNLAFAFPEASAAEREAMLRASWDNLGRVAAEFAFLEDIAGARLSISGEGHWETVRRSGRPAIFVSGHFANWEMLPAALRALGADFAAVYRPINNPLIDRHIRAARERATPRLIAKGKRGGREILGALGEGASVLMLVDQKLTSGGIPAPLFGRAAMTAPAAARLALRFGAPLLPIFMERLPRAHLRARLEAPIEPAGRSLETLLALLNERIEAHARAAPGEWLWHHRRFEKTLYDR